MLSANQPISENLPAHGCRHVAIIMDGNGRWAKRQGKIRAFGHKAGAKSVRRAVSFAANNGIDALTLYAFSSENWNRPAQEVSALMELFVWALDSEVKSLHRHNVRLRIIGETSRFNSRLQERIRKAEALTENNTGLTLNIAANYGGRWDIIQGVRHLAEQVQEGLLRPDQIDEEMLSQQICMFLALISVNLGIINLFPLPVLDGGHLLFLAIEKLKGGPVSERVQDFSYRIGSILLVLLMGLALFNDFSRL